MHAPQISTIEDALAIETDPKKKLELLNQMSRIMAFHDVEKAHELAKQALQLADEIGEPEGRARSLLKVGNACRNLAQYEAARQMIEQAWQLLAGLPAELPGKRLLIGEYHDSLGQLELDVDKVKEANEHLEIALEVYTQEGNRTGMAAILYSRGKAEARLRNDLVGLDYYKQALEIALDLGDDSLISMTSHGLGSLYVELGQAEQSLTYLRQALEHTDESRTVRIAALYNSMASAYRCNRDPDSAIEYSQKALDLYRQAQAPRGIAHTLHNLAAAHGERADYDMAMDYLRQALVVAESAGLLSLIEAIKGSIGTAHWMKGELNEALELLEWVADRLAGKRYRQVAYSSYWALANVHEGLGNTAEALKYFKLWADIKEEMQGRQKAEAVAVVERKMLLALHEREKEIYRLKNEQLERELARDRRELAALAAHLSQKNALMASLEQKVRQLDASPGSSQLAESIQAELRRTWDEGGQWQVFEERFRQVHPEFVRTLLGRYPELTPTEVKVCALMSINITTKEIADILYTSVRTVEGHRRFIRRKLGLERDANLSTFLAGLG